jgi:translation initiation factor IF-1
VQVGDNSRFYVSCFDVFNVLHHIFIRILMQE